MVYRGMINCRRQRPMNLYRDKPRPKWQRCFFYVMTLCVLFCTMLWTLRDTTPIQFVEPHMSDLNAPRGELATAAELENVYWRVSMREVNRALDSVCETSNYSVLTHKNVRMDGERMSTSYARMCSGPIRSVVNPRIVLTASGSSTVTCVETYANKTKHVTRKYPYSLKYVCGQTFVSRTRVVREKSEACLWAHAVDIVESVWD